MSLILSHNSQLLSVKPPSIHRSFATTPPSFSFIPLWHPRNPRIIKSTTIRLSSNIPPSTPSDDADAEPLKLTDEWGEKSDPETEPMTKLASSDPPKDEDEWGVDDGLFSVRGYGSAVVDDDSKIETLKKCLKDSVYGTGLGFSASADKRAEVIELVTQLEGVNPTPAPTDAVELLDGNWILLFTRLC